jgi:hypothetical protein
MTANGRSPYSMGYDAMTCLFCGRVVTVSVSIVWVGLDPRARWDISAMVRHIERDHTHTVRVLP